MSVMTALSLVLFFGFVATGLAGFLRWRQRMRQARVTTPTRKMKGYEAEGARS